MRAAPPDVTATGRRSSDPGCGADDTGRPADGRRARTVAAATARQRIASKRASPLGRPSAMSRGSSRFASFRTKALASSDRPVRVADRRPESTRGGSRTRTAPNGTGAGTREGPNARSARELRAGIRASARRLTIHTGVHARSRRQARTAPEAGGAAAEASTRAAYGVVALGSQRSAAAVGLPPGDPDRDGGPRRGRARGEVPTAQRSRHRADGTVLTAPC